MKAVELGANTFQIFSSSPRMWQASLPKAEDVERLKAVRAEHDLKPLVVHDSYLINLASTDPVCREKSIRAFRAEWERCVAIGADYLVAHPGNYKGQSVDEGISNFVAGLAEAVRDVPASHLTLLLECTAGSGAAIGSKFEELASIRDLALQQTRIPVGYCLDTAHCLASGYDVATAKGLRETVRQAESILGLENIPVIHANDSKVPLGSRVDRHQNIGEGYIGEDGFRRILTHPKLRRKAFILETPIEQDGDDLKNIEALKRLCQKSSTTTV